MVTAIVLISAERDKIHSVAEELADIKNVNEVYSVAGQYDLAAIIRAKNNERLASIVTDHMLKVEGIVKSETLFAFRVYSKHNLDNMFDLD